MPATRDLRRFPEGARHGRGLFYRNGGKVMAVEIDAGPAFRARTPKVLFDGRYLDQFGSYDGSADGKRFLMLRGGQEETGGGQVYVVLEWFEEIRRRVRAGNAN